MQVEVGISPGNVLQICLPPPPTMKKNVLSRWLLHTCWQLFSSPTFTVFAVNLISLTKREWVPTFVGNQRSTMCKQSAEPLYSGPSEIVLFVEGSIQGGSWIYESFPPWNWVRDMKSCCMESIVNVLPSSDSKQAPLRTNNNINNIIYFNSIIPFSYLPPFLWVCSISYLLTIW